MANVFVSSGRKARVGRQDSCYTRFDDDILSKMPSIEAASIYYITFTMELPNNGRIPCIGMDILKTGSLIRQP